MRVLIYLYLAWIYSVQGDPLILQYNVNSFQLYNHTNGSFSVLHKTNIGYSASDHFFLQPSTFDYLYDIGRVYWHDGKSRSIKYLSLVDSSVQEIRTNLPDRSVYVQCDWIGRNIYFTRSHSLTVEVSDIDGQHIKTLYKTYGTAFQIDGEIFQINPTNGLMYWNGKDGVSLGSMNGDMGSLAIMFKLRFILTMAIDNLEGNLYISAGNIPVVIYVANFNGSSLKEIFINEEDIISGLALFENWIYYTAYIAKAVYVCDKVTMTNCTTVRQEGKLGLYLEIYDEALQPKVSHPCQGNTSGCSGLCLLSTAEPYYECECEDYFILTEENKCKKNEYCIKQLSGCTQKCIRLQSKPFYKCECYPGYELLLDNKTCSGGNGSLLLVKTDTLSKIWLDTPNFSEMTLSEHTTGSDIAEYDPITGDILWLYNTIEIPLTLQASNIENAYETSLYEFEDSAKSVVLEWWSRRLFYEHSDYVGYINIDNVKRHSCPFEDYGIDNVIGLAAADSFYGVYIWIYTTEYQVRLNILADDCSSLRKAPGNVKQRKLMYFDFESGRIYSSQGGKISVSYLDGTQEQIFFPLQNDLRVIAIAVKDKSMFFVQHDKIKNSFTIEMLSSANSSIKRIKEFDRDVLSPIIKVVNFVKSSEVATLICEPYAKCLSITNSWMCLNPNMICDGIKHCYDGHDERFCNICNGTCAIISLVIDCVNMGNSIQPSPNISEFVNWNTHPFSTFTHLPNFFLYECSLSAFFENGFNVSGFREFTIFSLHLEHRFRQLLITNMFRSMENMSKLVLSGPSSKDRLENYSFRDTKNLRELIVSKTMIKRLLSKSLSGLFELEKLHFLNNVRLTDIETGSLNHLEKLREIYMSGNNIEIIRMGLFLNLTNLNYLTLTGISLKSIEYGSFRTLFLLKTVVIMDTSIRSLPVNLLQENDNIQSLDLRNNLLSVLPFGILDNLENLEVIDLRGNDMYVDSNIFLYATSLRKIYSSTYAFCCIKPSSVKEKDCVAPLFDVSSCADLIYSKPLRAVLWIMGFIAVFGNLAVVILRNRKKKKKSRVTKSTSETFNIFVTNLAISDFVMGIYMLVIALFDAKFAGSYVWNEYLWRRSPFCIIAGFLSMISSELSMLMISLITLDRFFIFKFQFGGIRISRKSSIILSIASWVLSAVIAIVPVFHFPTFFSRSGVCIGLPLYDREEDGFEYSIAIFLAFNFIIFCFITAGQIMIFYVIKTAKVESTSKIKHRVVFNKLFVVFLTDAMCWIPIGITILIARFGTEIPRETYAWLVIFVMPVNAAINPLIYTFSGLKICTIQLRKKKYRVVTGSMVTNDTKFRDHLYDLKRNDLSPYITLLAYTSANSAVHVRDIFIVILCVVKGLHRLHHKQYFHGCIDEKNVVIIHQNGKIKKARLAIKETSGPRIDEPAVDIEQLGQMLKRLLRKVKIKTESSEEYPRQSNNSNNGSNKSRFRMRMCFWLVIVLIGATMVAVFVTLFMVMSFESKQITLKKSYALECRLTPRGTDYSGVLNIASNGKHCLKWKEMKEYWLKEESNYCQGFKKESCPFCHVMTTTEQNSTYRESQCCSLPMCHESLVKKECINGTGDDYNGQMNRTETSRICQRWDAQTPHNHSYTNMSDQENFCRNPNGDMLPWCFTIDEKKRWEHCFLPECGIEESCIHRDGEFSFVNEGKLYNGNVSVTSTGRPCMSWADATKAGYKTTYLAREVHNHCRNDILSRPYCYVAGTSGEWEFCDVPICNEK